MNLTSAATIKELLSKYEAKPKKGLGQNFLIDKNILDKIVQAANIKNTDTVLEVGPGIGTLTQELAKTAGHVVAVEKDSSMIEILSETLSGFTNVEVINNDILKIKQSLPADYKLVANIPYYLTSPLIRLFLEAEHQPQDIVLLVQKEVAQRICAKPGDMSLLAVSVQFYANCEIVFNVSKNSFWPIPKVDSAVIKITPKCPHPKISLGPTSLNLFFKVVKAGFSHPRKQLIGNLSGQLNLPKEQVKDWLSKNNINSTQRAETLSVEDWVVLAKSFPNCE